MEKLTGLFGGSIRFAYRCFDRIVIRGYLSMLSRPENIEYFFRTIKQVECIGKETLRQRTVRSLDVHAGSEVRSARGRWHGPVPADRDLLEQP
jgi:hypothetical protein